MTLLKTEFLLPLTLEQQAAIRPFAELGGFLPDALRIVGRIEQGSADVLYAYRAPDGYTHSLEFGPLPKPLMQELTEAAMYYRMSHGGAWPFTTSDDQTGSVWFFA